MVVVSPLSSSSRRPNGALPTVVYYQVNWQISVGIDAGEIEIAAPVNHRVDA
jgi:hypothetical protein